MIYEYRDRFSDRRHPESGAGLLNPHQSLRSLDCVAALQYSLRYRLPGFLGCIVDRRVTAAVAEPTGQVIRVSDGDTITILASGSQQIRIRLAWIDAPERGQAFGNVSRAALAVLVAGKTVQVEQVDVDRYGRTVGTVFVDGTDACLAQVKAGLAWVYDHYVVNAPAAIQSQYYEAQKEARSARAGLWIESNPTAPWVFRRAALAPGLVFFLPTGFEPHDIGGT